MCCTVVWRRGHTQSRKALHSTDSYAHVRLQLCAGGERSSTQCVSLSVCKLRLVSVGVNATATMMAHRK